MPDGDVVLATAIGIVPLSGSSCRRASWSSNQSATWVTTSPRSRRMMTPERLVHAGPLGDGIDAHHHGVGDEGAGTGAEHGPTVGHVVELDEAVGNSNGL